MADLTHFNTCYRICLIFRLCTCCLKRCNTTWGSRFLWGSILLKCPWPKKQPAPGLLLCCWAQLWPLTSLTSTSKQFHRYSQYYRIDTYIFSLVVILFAFNINWLCRQRTEANQIQWVDMWVRQQGSVWVLWLEASSLLDLWTPSELSYTPWQTHSYSHPH